MMPPLIVLPLLAVNTAGAASPIAMLEGDRTLELVILLECWVRPRHPQQLAQLNDEALRGGKFRGLYSLPSLDESLALLMLFCAHGAQMYPGARDPAGRKKGGQLAALGRV